MKSFAKILIITGLILMFTTLLLKAEVTLIDTLISIPELDGNVVYTMGYDVYASDTTYGAHSVGDWWDAIDGAIQYGRMFLAYPLPDIPEDYILTNATIYVYQNVSSGDGIYYVNPRFNNESGYTEPPCLIEPVNYGTILDITDFHLPALHPADTISSTPEQGWRNVNVTDWVLDDLENNRSYAQSRLRLSLNNDTDWLRDYIQFASANTWHDLKPYIIYEYEPESSLEDEPELEITNSSVQIYTYPNPVSTQGKIMLTAKEPVDLSLALYNIKGQLVKKLYSGNMERGSKEHSFNTEHLASGIYFVKSSSKLETTVKKIVIQK